MNGSYRHTESRAFGPTLEWERLPILGAAPRRRRQRSMRLAIAGMGMVWVGAIATAMVLYG